MRRRLWKGGLAIAILLALGVAAAGVWVRAQLRGSLPLLGGDMLEGLSAPVIVTRRPRHPDRERRLARRCGARDRLLHAQDRFFQMDLARRRAAGELCPGWRAGDRGRQADPHASLSRRSPTGSRRDGPGMARDHRGLHVGGEQRFESTASRPSNMCYSTRAPQVAGRRQHARCAVHVHHASRSGRLAEATLATMHDVLPEAMANFPGADWHRVGLANRGPRARCPTDPVPRYDLRSPSGQPPQASRPRPPTRLLRPIEQGSDELWESGIGTWELEVGLRLSLRPPRPFDKLRVAPSRVEGRAASRGGNWELIKREL